MRTASSATVGLAAICLAIALLGAHAEGRAAGSTVRVPTTANEVTVISVLPAAQRGADIEGRPEFGTTSAEVADGFVTVEIDDEPVWIIEGSLPQADHLTADRSPFGFHPAPVRGVGYDSAREIGVVWDRCGLYFMWVLIQRDPVIEQYDWTQYDPYFKRLPEGMRVLKNITVAHDGMVERPGRPPKPRVEHRRPVDVSEYLEGTTYRPKDPEAYSRWVRAAVERYDGDGENDMPGLRIPVKHWQVDNEPPRGRAGYADLVRVTSRAVKQADPEAKVLVGGLVLPRGNGVRLYQDQSLPILKELNGEGIDILDLHWFGPVGEWRMLPEALARVRTDLRDCGFKDIPVWICEMGTYSGHPASRRGRPELPRQSEREQASEMLKRHAVALGEGVEKIFWAWGMMEGFIDVRDNDVFDNTGFVYDGIGPDDPGRGTKKIVYWAYQEMTRLLRHWDGSRPEKLDSGQGVVAYRFRFGMQEDRGIVIAWRKNEDRKHLNSSKGDNRK